MNMNNIYQTPINCPDSRNENISLPPKYISSDSYFETQEGKEDTLNQYGTKTSQNKMSYQSTSQNKYKWKNTNPNHSKQSQSYDNLAQKEQYQQHQQQLSLKQHLNSESPM